MAENSLPVTTDSNQYGLLVIQAGVLAGAQEARVRHEGWLTTFELVGASLPGAVLERLLEHVASPGAAGAMARAVELALATRPREVRVSCGGRQLRLRGRNRAVLNKGPADLTLEVDRRPASVRRVLASYPHRLEDAPLQASCQLSPIPVSIGGTPVRTRFSLKGCLAALLLETREGELTGLPVYLPARNLLARLPAPGPFAMAVGLTAEEADSKTTLVVDGVSCQGHRVSGLRAVVWASDLPLKESLGEAEECELTALIREQLEAARGPLREMLWERLPSMTASQRARALPFLEPLASTARLAQLQKLLEVQEGGPSASLLGIAAERARVEGDLLEAQTYYLKALEHPDARRRDLLPELVKIMARLRARPRQLEPYVRELCSELSQKLGNSHRHALAGYFERMGEYAATHGYERDARGYLAEAISIQESLLGKHHPSVERLRETLDSL